MFIFLILFFLTLQYCIGFGIYQNESATGIRKFNSTIQTVFHQIFIMFSKN